MIPESPAPAGRGDRKNLPGLRSWTRLSFHALFLFAPALNIFRFDIHRGHFILLGHDWKLGLDGFLQQKIGADAVFASMVVYGFMPIALLIGTGFLVSRHFGRLYCGWLCPHHSAVEIINRLMLRTLGRPTLWQRQFLQDDACRHYPPPRRIFLLPTLLTAAGFSLVWSLALLTYIWPPGEILSALRQLDLSRAQWLFLLLASSAFFLDLLLARHLFCRYGCSVGLFQGLAWMTNPRALVVGFNRQRVSECIDCHGACDNACPLRLRPRASKRHIFSCTQCGICIHTCQQVHRYNPQGPLLHWTRHAAALDKSTREPGRPADQTGSAHSAPTSQA